MMNDILLQWGGFLLTPVCSVVAWLAGRRVRNNNTLNEMQRTIDVLVEKNQELINEIIDLRQNLVKIQAENAELKQLITNAKPKKK